MAPLLAPLGVSRQAQIGSIALSPERVRPFLAGCCLNWNRRRTRARRSPLARAREYSPQRRRREIARELLRRGLEFLARARLEQGRVATLLFASGSRGDGVVIKRHGFSRHPLRACKGVRVAVV